MKSSTWLGQICGDSLDDAASNGHDDERSACAPFLLDRRPGNKVAGAPVFAPHAAPAHGWGAVPVAATALREQGIVLKGSRTLLSMNQPDGAGCLGSAWPDLRHASSFECSENGAKTSFIIGQNPGANSPRMLPSRTGHRAATSQSSYPTRPGGHRRFMLSRANYKQHLSG
jgi:hypothetical protein